MDMNELQDCIVTPEQTLAELEALEAKLAAKLNITGNVREELIRLDRANLLEEDSLVADWQATYSSYLNDIEYKSSLIG